MINKGTIIRNFSRYAHYYDRYAAIQNRCAQKLISQIADQHFSKILDVGCGTGNFTHLLRDRFPAAEIEAIDMSPEMIKVAEEKLKGKNIGFIVADAEIFDFKNKFDLISSNVSLQWFQDMEKTLWRYKGALSKGGMILFSTLGPKTFFELHKSLAQFHNQPVAISAWDFTTKSAIGKILKSIFCKFDLEEIIYDQEYPSLIDLLNNIKYTGARGKGLMVKNFWTNGLLERIEQIYRKNFNTITATYQVFFCKIHDAIL